MNNLKVIWSLQKIAFKQYLEHRWGAFGSIINATFALLFSMFFISIIFTKIDALNGWTQNELFLILGIFRIELPIISLIFRHGVNSLIHSVESGELDLILTKPINSQIFITFRYPKLYELINVIAGLALVIYSLSKMEISFGILDFVILLISMILGTMIFYSIYFCIATLAIWFGRFTSFTEFFYILREPLSLPRDVLDKPLAWFITYIIPLGLIVSVPVEIFIGKSSLSLLFIEIIFSILTLGLSIWFWNFSLKRYSSASS
jgi:ABC-2 type transport system permease protein